MLKIIIVRQDRLRCAHTPNAEAKSWRSLKLRTIHERAEIATTPNSKTASWPPAYLAGKFICIVHWKIRVRYVVQWGCHSPRQGRRRRSRVKYVLQLRKAGEWKKNCILQNANTCTTNSAQLHHRLAAACGMQQEAQPVQYNEISKAKRSWG